MRVTHEAYIATSFASFSSVCVFFNFLTANDSMSYHLSYHDGFTFPNRDLKQARTATAVNKQLNLTVKNKPHTTNYIYCIFEAYFIIRSV